MKKITFLSIAMLTIFSSFSFAKEFNVGSFDKIYLKGPFGVTLIQSNQNKVIVDADQKYLDELLVNNDDGQLSLDLDRKWKNSNDIRVKIYFKELEEIKVTGAVSIRSESKIDTKNLKIQFKGAGEVDLDLDCEKLIAEISGVGDFDLAGSADYHKVTFSGVGNYDASRLISENTSVNSNGIGSVSVHAGEKLIARASGIGNIEFVGDPKYKDINASGLGSVDHRK